MLYNVSELAPLFEEIYIFYRTCDKAVYTTFAGIDTDRRRIMTGQNSFIEASVGA